MNESNAPTAIEPNTPAYKGHSAPARGVASILVRLFFTFLTVQTGIMLVFLCSCSTDQSAHRSLAAEVPINNDAGRGGLLIVTLRLENGQKLPFIVDTGSDCTIFDTSLAPQLGKPIGTTVGELAGIKATNNYYAAPRLFLGGLPLVMSSSNIVAWNCSGISACLGRPVMGILGMDVLEHYCIQLDFSARKMRLLGGEQAAQTCGKAFPIVPLNAEDSRPAVGENLFGASGSHSLIDSGYNSDGWLMPMYFRQWTNEAVWGISGEARYPHGVFGGEKYPFVSLDEKDFKSDAIGIRFLARHCVTLDFPHHTLYLERQSTGPLPDPRMDEFKPISDKDPKLTAHLHGMIQDMVDGTMHGDDYTAEAWEKAAPKQKAFQAETKRLGDFVSLTIVDRGHAGGLRSYRYRLQFTNATILVRFILDGQNKVASAVTEARDWNPVMRKPIAQTAKPFSPNKEGITSTKNQSPSKIKNVVNY